MSFAAGVHCLMAALMGGVLDGAAQCLDPVSALAEDGLLWYDVRALEVEGRGWTGTESPFDRLPARAKGMVRDALWDLSKHSAGMAVRFVTDAEEISARWTLRSKATPVEYMPASGSSGLDLYARDGGRWRWAGLARPSADGENKVRILINIPKEPHEYLLYLPLFNGVESVRIGVKPEAGVFRSDGAARKPIVFYGTSITHGVAASRPGMAYPAILSRRLDRPDINLGFASNGTMDPEMVELMGEIDAAAYVIDCLPNMDTAMVAARTEPLIERLRKARPDVPIVLVEHIEQSNAWLLPALEESIRERNRALREAYEKLRKAGVANLHYVSGADLLGRDSEAAVDGIHPSDMGFTRIADELEPLLRRLVK